MALYINGGSQESWRDFLTEFDEKIYPFFEMRGVSYQMALVIWELNRLRNMQDVGEDDDEEEYA